MDIQALVEIEAIKQLKARYMRGVDTRDWELLATTFAPNARSIYNDGKYSFDGRDTIMEFLSTALSKSAATMHHAHTPEIEITSATTARALWYLEDFIINEENESDPSRNNTVLHGSGIYSDEYLKIDGEWKILLTGYERIFEDTQPRDPGCTLRTRFKPS